MTTPEGRVKQMIRRVLNSYGHGIHYEMPVPSAFGSRTVDFLVCAWGVFVAIEAKAGKNEVTLRQKEYLKSVSTAGGVALVVRDDGEEWLRHVLDELKAFTSPPRRV